MRTPPYALALLVAGMAAVVACGLQVVGAGEPPADTEAAKDASASTGETSTVPIEDAGADTTDSTPNDACPPSACSIPQPTGAFDVVLFGDGAGACPAPLKTTAVIESPTAGAGACDCNACSANVSCASGNITTFTTAPDGGACDTADTPIAANNSTCTNLAAPLSQDLQIAAPTAVVGPCTSTGKSDKSKVTTTQRKLCSLPTPAPCSDGLCSAVSPALRACLLAVGDVECPSTAPEKHLVGKTFDLACSACTCTVTAECDGHLDLFTDAGCKGTKLTVNTNVCTTATGPFNSYDWNPGGGSRSCQKTPGEPTLSLTEERTVCCP